MGVHQFGNWDLRASEQELSQAVQSLIFRGREAAKQEVLTKRSLIQWQLPHLASTEFIEMYINPQNIQFSSRKEINRVRTKGGYIAQYWGEDLDSVTIAGTTGDAGIEGINVLRDVYRSEQLALLKIVQNDPDDKRRQSLMQLAASVIMWYQGLGYRGFFTDMTYTESVNRLGLFDYNMTFVVVEFLGSRRRNFLPWHRHPWSTTETPNLSSDQSRAGGGYDEGRKIGVLNAPPFRLEARAVRNEEGDNVGTVQVAILRPDPKDFEGTGAARINVQRAIDSGVPR